MKEIKQINKTKEVKGKQEEVFDYYEVENDDGSVTTGIKDFHWQYKKIEKEIKEKKKEVKKELRNEDNAL